MAEIKQILNVWAKNDRQSSFVRSENLEYLGYFSEALSAHFCHCASFNASLIHFFSSFGFEINDHAKQYMSDEFEFCKELVGVILFRIT